MTATPAGSTDEGRLGVAGEGDEVVAEVKPAAKLAVKASVDVHRVDVPNRVAPLAQGLGAQGLGAQRPDADGGVTPEGVWARALLLAEGSPALHSCMERLRLVEIVGGGPSPRAVVGHAARDKVAAEMALTSLARVIGQALGAAVSVSLRAVAGPGASESAAGADRRGGEEREGAGEGAGEGAAVDRGEGAGAEAAPAVDERAALADPLVGDAIALLGATVKGVRARGGA